MRIFEHFCLKNTQLESENFGERLTSRVGTGEVILISEKFQVPIYSVLLTIPTKISSL